MATNVELFKFTLEQRAKQNKGGKLKIRKGKTTWLYPSGIERRYYKYIRNIMKRYTKVTETVKPKIGSWKLDAMSDDIDNMNDEFEQLRQEIFQDGKQETKDDLRNIAIAILLFNQLQFQRILKSQLDVTFTLEATVFTAIIDRWVSNNYNLVKGLTEEYVKKINNALTQGIQTNVNVADIKKQITTINKNMTGFRSDLIARDQTGNANGDFTEKSNTEIGVSIYEWITKNDERVRGRPGGKYPKATPKHWQLHRKLCKWSDPAVYADTLEDALEGKWKSRSSIGVTEQHPGQAIGCRCGSMPVLEGVV